MIARGRVGVAIALVCGGLAASFHPAAARNEPLPDPATTPTPAPIYGLQSPPPTVLAAAAAATCANDVFLAFRTLPRPTKQEVTVCGSVAATGAGSFTVDVDGTEPISVAAPASAAAPQPGDIVIVRGRYHREKSGAEGIDQTQRATGGWPYDGFIELNGTVHQ